MVCRALYTAATSMAARQLETDIISNNIANINTTAYKKQRAESSDLFYQYYKRAGSDTNTTIPSGVYIGAGVAIQGVSRLLTEGPLEETKNDLHVAIMGKGYFKIELPDGTLAYTRAGNFQRNQDGQIVTHRGHVVSPGITIPTESTSVMIDTDGTVSVLLPGTIPPQEISRLEITTFVNEGGLEVIGDNLYAEAIASGAPVDGIADENGFGAIKHRWLEGSNIDITVELTNLITTQRAFETSSKIIQAADDMLQTINQSKR